MRVSEETDLLYVITVLLFVKLKQFEKNNNYIFVKPVSDLKNDQLG